MKRETDRHEKIMPKKEPYRLYSVIVVACYQKCRKSNGNREKWKNRSLTKNEKNSAYAYSSLYTYIHQSATITKYKTPLNYPSDKHQKEPA